MHLLIEMSRCAIRESQVEEGNAADIKFQKYSNATQI
jgi:hypothetical protein